jgi:hypothetical protein
MKMASCLVPETILSNLKNGSLFYPCSGDDVVTPIKAFSPYLSDFWFVDIRSVNPSLIEKRCGYRLVDSHNERVEGETLRRREPFRITVNHEVYRNISIGAEIRVHRCCGRGYDAFRVLFKNKSQKISVFFYRGDSMGEGGSGFYWLRRGRLRNLLEVLEDGGLIVSDGSNAMRRLAVFHSGDSMTGSEAFSEAETFRFANRQFQCVGYLDNRYGPTLIWQATNLEDRSQDKGP